MKKKAIVLIFCVIILFSYFWVLLGKDMFTHMDHDQYVPGGLYGDQTFYVWAIERSKNSQSMEDFFNNCRFRKEGCVRLDSVPQEWTSFYLLGKISNLLGWTSQQILSHYYFFCLLLNLFACCFFIYAVSKNIYLAVGLSPIAAFQFSVLARIVGHASLVSIWQIVFALGFFWLMMEQAIKKKWYKGYAYSILAAISYGFALFQTYYYTGFSLLLITTIFIIFCTLHDTLILPRLRACCRMSVLKMNIKFRQFFKKMIHLILAKVFHSLVALLKSDFIIFVKRLLLLCLPIIVSILIVFPFIRYVFTGAEGYKDRYSHYRSTGEVIHYSARPIDFLRPPPRTYVYKFFSGIGIKITNPYQSGVDGKLRGEVISYLGTSFWLLFIITILSIIKRIYKDKNFSCKDHIFFLIFFIGFFVVAFFSSKYGAIYYHKLQPGLRVFSRLAPYTALMGVTGFSLYWRTRPKLKVYILSSLIFFLTFFFQYNNPMVQNIRNNGIDPDQVKKTESLIIEMDAVCKKGALRVNPPAPTFILGPYPIYYLIEKTNCKVDGIGHVFAPHTPETEYPAIIGEIQYPKEKYLDIEYLKVKEYEQ